MRYKVVPVSVKCEGDSLWGKTSEVALKPKEGELSHCNWKPGDIEKRLFVSLSLFGDGFVLAHYTDSGIPWGLLKSKAFTKQLRKQVTALLVERGLAKPVPAKIAINWSEYGLQPEGGWNFDVTFTL